MLARSGSIGRLVARGRVYCGRKMLPNEGREVEAGLPTLPTIPRHNRPGRLGGRHIDKRLAVTINLLRLHLIKELAQRLVGRAWRRAHQLNRLHRSGFGILFGIFGKSNDFRSKSAADVVHDRRVLPMVLWLMFGGAFALVGVEVFLAEAKGVRRDLKELVIFDKVNRLLKAQLGVWRQLDGAVA